MAKPSTYYNIGRGFINNSSIFNPTSAISCTSTIGLAKTPILTIAATLAKSFGYVLGLLRKFIDKNLQIANKFAFKSLSKAKSIASFKQTPEPGNNVKKMGFQFIL